MTDFAEVVLTATLAKSSEAGLRRSRRVRAHGLMEMGELAAAILVVATRVRERPSALWGATATATAALKPEVELKGSDTPEARPVLRTITIVVVMERTKIKLRTKHGFLNRRPPYIGLLLPQLVPGSH